MAKLLRRGRGNPQHDWSNSGSFISRPANGWLHPDDQLSPNAGICYGLRYVGSMQVLESMKALDFNTRTMITKESIGRVCCAVGLKTAGKKSRKSASTDRFLAEEPNLMHACKDVNVTITTESVTIVDMDNCDLIVHHLMPSISFASGGDQDTMDFVAYVAKDDIHGRACHVIECGGGLAQDVITTIGQAFELRFKSYLAQRAVPLTVPSRNDASRQEYYNDQFESVNVVLPPVTIPTEQRSPASVTSASEYQSPSSSRPLTNSVSESPLISFDDVDSGAAAAAASHGTNDIEDRNLQIPVYAVSQKKTTELDSFDMKPFNSLLQAGNDAPPVMAPPSPRSNPGLAMRHNSVPHAEPWFHGRISRQKCEELLLHDGDFLVRESPSTPGQYVLSGRHKGCIRHLLLVDPEGKVRTKDQLFNSVGHLVDFHMTHGVPIVSADSELVLITPVVRGSREM